ncbi:uncharacterized protein FTOL_08357 [Fusarium torulosum]|uniref:Uncharacterized protein n=1 Tax=Fusarium torulosum TaxID=33205 RepID=A0AAE8MF57_9HYPO|nr:uncharacterized protein FTOL_08357 [Fusarium torulosum]
MHFTKIAILATAGLVAAENAAAPEITAPAVLRRDLPGDVKSWAESKASGANPENWIKSHASEAYEWASGKGGDAKSWAEQATEVKEKYSTAVNAAESKVDAAKSKASGALNDAKASASAANNDNAAVTLGSQAGVVAMMAALGATAFGFLLI